jgi:tryptophan halogenase
LSSFIISLHYKFNARLQTPFWTECRSRVDYSGAAAVVEFYEENGPSGFSRALLDPTDPFGIEGYLVLLLGQKAPTRTRYNASEYERTTWRTHRATIAEVADAGITPEEALPILKSPSGCVSGPGT